MSKELKAAEAALEARKDELVAGYLATASVRHELAPLEKAVVDLTPAEKDEE